MASKFGLTAPPNGIAGASRRLFKIAEPVNDFETLTW